MKCRLGGESRGTASIGGKIGPLHRPTTAPLLRGLQRLQALKRSSRILRWCLFWPGEQFDNTPMANVRGQHQTSSPMFVACIDCESLSKQIGDDLDITILDRIFPDGFHRIPVLSAPRIGPCI